MPNRRKLLQLSAAMVLSGAGRARAAGQRGSVDEQGFVRIGGIDQWIAIQGRDAANPAILYLHGGPGEAQSPFLKEFLPWEQDFTVVNWDQRGAGKTYGRNGPSTPDMTLERLAADAVEVAEHARRRLGKRKLILVGQSWGSVLGPHVVKLRPSLFHAYVGTAQAVSWVSELAEQEQWARAQATALGDAETLKALDAAAGLAPDDPRRTSPPRKYRMSPPDLEYVKILGAFTGPPPLPKTGDVADWINGYGFSTRTVGSSAQLFDIRKLGLDYPIPVFVIQGVQDHIVFTKPAEAWVASLNAPAKAYLPIDGGHFACFTNPEGFLGALRAHVLPLAGR